MNMLARLLTGDFSNILNICQIGTGTTAAAKTDIQLGIFLVSTSNPNLTYSLITSGVTLKAVFPRGVVSASYAVTELGFFSGSVMYNHVVFNSVPISTTIKLTFKLDLTFD